MKKIILLFAGLAILASGCSAGRAAEGPEKLCRIELYSAQSGEQLAVLDDQEQIKALWNTEEWETCDELPAGLTPEYQLFVLQEKTLLYGQDPEEEQEYETIAVLTTFQNSAYIQETISDGAVKSMSLPEDVLTLYYTVPDETLELLHTLAKQELEQQYNLPLYYSGFAFDKVEVDGIPYYQLTQEDGEIVILINSAETRMEVQRTGDHKTVAVDIPWFLPSPVPETVSVTVMDVTGDGVDDLIYRAAGGGTGVHAVYCQVCDLESEKVYQVSNLNGAEFIAHILSDITVEGVDVENNYALCKVAIPGFTPQGAGINLAHGITMENCDFTVYTAYFDIWEENENLYTLINFSIASAVPGFYLGSIDAILEFDAENETFVVSEEEYLNLNLFSPENLL